MGEVVELPKRWTQKEIAVFTCGCGGQTFFCMADGKVVCTECRFINTPLAVLVREGYTVPA